MTSPQPTTVGGYEILGELGRGGLGVVYRARDTRLQREVALRVIHPHLLADPASVERFLRAVRAAARLKHPNVVTIYDAAEAEGRVFIVMELLAGRTLDQLLAQNERPDLKAAVSIVEQVGAALGYAHAQGVLHLNVRPSNLIVDADGHVTLTGLGLAGAGAEAGLTGGDVQAGAPAYMAPEQLDSSLGETGPRTDLYSLGAVAYEMLAGRPPSAASDSQSPAGLDPRISQVLRRALARKPADRFASCAEFLIALQKAAAPEKKGEQVSPSPGPLPGTAGEAADVAREEPWSRREGWRPGWLTPGLAAAGVGLVLLIWLGVWGKVSGAGPLARLFWTPLPTRTATATSVATPAPIRTPTHTTAPTSTAMATSPAIRTATATGTAMVTSPAILTATPTGTNTPAITPTRTAAPTPTATPSVSPPVPTSTPPPTLAPTQAAPPTSAPTQAPSPAVEPTSPPPPPPTATPEPAPTWTPPA